MLKTAWLMDTVGNKGARIEVSAIKVAAPNVAPCGWSTGPSRPTAAWGVRRRAAGADVRPPATLRLADGPDEVHRMSVARRELRRYET